MAEVPAEVTASTGALLQETLGEAREAEVEPPGADQVRAYVESLGIPDPQKAADGISRALQQLAAQQMGGGDAPYPSVVRDRGHQGIVEGGTPAEATTEAVPSKLSPQQKLEREAAGILGDVTALRETLADKGRASSIVPKLVTREIPVWDVRGTTIRSPADMHAAVWAIRSPYFESIKVAVLDADNVVVHSQIVSVGSINAAIVDARGLVGILEQVRRATGKKYNRIILSHNHPSGDPTPSPEDIATTRKLAAAAKELGFEVLDHVGDFNNRRPLRACLKSPFAGRLRIRFAECVS